MKIEKEIIQEVRELVQKTIEKEIDEEDKMSSTNRNPKRIAYLNEIKMIIDNEIEEFLKKETQSESEKVQQAS